MLIRQKAMTQSGHSFNSKPVRVLHARQAVIADLLREKRERIISIAQKHGASNVRLFGSVARGESDVQSDIDLLVQMEEGGSLLDHAALHLELEDLLGCKVDVVSERGLKPRIKERVLKEAMPL